MSESRELRYKNNSIGINNTEKSSSLKSAFVLSRTRATRVHKNSNKKFLFSSSQYVMSIPLLLLLTFAAFNHCAVQAQLVSIDFSNTRKPTTFVQNGAAVPVNAPTPSTLPPSDGRPLPSLPTFMNNGNGSPPSIQIIVIPNAFLPAPDKGTKPTPPVVAPVSQPTVTPPTPPAVPTENPPRTVPTQPIISTILPPVTPVPITTRGPTPKPTVSTNIQPPTPRPTKLPVTNSTVSPPVYVPATNVTPIGKSSFTLAPTVANNNTNSSPSVPPTLQEPIGSSANNSNLTGLPGASFTNAPTTTLQGSGGSGLPTYPITGQARLIMDSTTGPMLADSIVNDFISTFRDYLYKHINSNNERSQLTNLHVAIRQNSQTWGRRKRRLQQQQQGTSQQQQPSAPNATLNPLSVVVAVQADTTNSQLKNLNQILVQTINNNRLDLVDMLSRVTSPLSAAYFSTIKNVSASSADGGAPSTSPPPPKQTPLPAPSDATPSPPPPKQTPSPTSSSNNGSPSSSSNSKSSSSSKNNTGLIIGIIIALIILCCLFSVFGWYRHVRRRRAQVLAAVTSTTSARANPDKYSHPGTYFDEPTTKHDSNSEDSSSGDHEDTTTSGGNENDETTSSGRSHSESYTDRSAPSRETGDDSDEESGSGTGTGTDNGTDENSSNDPGADTLADTSDSSHDHTQSSGNANQTFARSAFDSNNPANYEDAKDHGGGGGSVDGDSYNYSLGPEAAVDGAAVATDFSRREDGDTDNDDTDGEGTEVDEDILAQQENMVARDVDAPPGKLGIVIDTTLEGPVVHKVNGTSPLDGLLFPGDIIVAIDEIDTRAMSASAITALMVKTANRRRKLRVISEDTQ